MRRNKDLKMLFLLFINIILQTVLQVRSHCPVCTANETRLLNDGNVIPALAYGTLSEIPDFNKVVPSVIFAIEAGFRHLNTADLYETEQLIGQALSDVFRRGIVRREEMFITTKLDIVVHTRQMVLPSLRQSLKKLQLDYVDLLLLHAPYSPFGFPDFDFVNIWKGLEDAKRFGLTKSIGVSNFNSSDINRLLRHAKIRPAVNEIHVCTSYTNLDLVSYCQSQGIVVTGYSPFGFLVPRLNTPNRSTPLTFLENHILVKIARKYGKDPSQVVLRYMIDRGVIPIPKSHSKTHTLLNLDIFDFRLTPEEIYTINEYNGNIPVYPVDDEKAMSSSFRHAYNLFKNIK